MARALGKIIPLLVNPDFVLPVETGPGPGATDFARRIVTHRGAACSSCSEASRLWPAQPTRLSVTGVFRMSPRAMPAQAFDIEAVSELADRLQLPRQGEPPASFLMSNNKRDWYERIYRASRESPPHVRSLVAHSDAAVIGFII